MLSPEAWVTVAERMELLPIVRLTDGFRRCSQFVEEASINRKIAKQESPLPLSNDLAVIISNSGLFGCMVPDKSGWGMLDEY